MNLGLVYHEVAYGCLLDPFLRFVDLNIPILAGDVHFDCWLNHHDLILCLAAIQIPMCFRLSTC